MYAHGTIGCFSRQSCELGSYLSQAVLELIHKLNGKKDKKSSFDNCFLFFPKIKPSKNSSLQTNQIDILKANCHAANRTKDDTRLLYFVNAISSKGSSKKKKYSPRHKKPSPLLLGLNEILDSIQAGKITVRVDNRLDRSNTL